MISDTPFSDSSPARSVGEGGVGAERSEVVATLHHAWTAGRAMPPPNPPPSASQPREGREERFAKVLA